MRATVRATESRTQWEIEKAAIAAAWYKNLSETSNKTFMPLYGCKKRYLVLMGGGGSGKSIFAGRKILERASSEPGHRILVCRKVDKTIRESCFEQLKRQALTHYGNETAKIPMGKSSDMYIKFKNGSEIIFSGLDNVEKLKSIYAVTGIWIEEATELSESDFNQLDIRLREKTSYYQQIILSFNPISLLHWLKNKFFDPATPDPRAKTHHSTYKDNRFLSEDAIQTLEAYKDTDPYYYMVYCLGKWGVTGTSVFDNMALTKRLQENIKPGRVGMFEYKDSGSALKDRSFYDNPDGFIRIYEEPKERRPYVIGGDTAGEGSDCFTAQVIDNTTGKQVAVMRHKFDEDLYAKQIYCLGMYYNTALIAPETNFSTYPVMEMERLRYPKIYVRQTIDDYTHKIKHSYGFSTNSKTRPVIIANLIKAIREDPTLVCDDVTINEMLTFVRNENFRPEAIDGAHDDTVMALAIAHYVRPQQEYIEAPPQNGQTKWTKDMLEDYENASEELREYLIKRWGQPKR